MSLLVSGLARGFGRVVGCGEADPCLRKRKHLGRNRWDGKSTGFTGSRASN
jgi:hypothetical protein